MFAYTYCYLLAAIGQVASTAITRKKLSTSPRMIAAILPEDDLSTPTVVSRDAFIETPTLQRDAEKSFDLEESLLLVANTVPSPHPTTDDQSLPVTDDKLLSANGHSLVPPEADRSPISSVHEVPEEQEDLSGTQALREGNSPEEEGNSPEENPDYAIDVEVEPSASEEEDIIALLAKRNKAYIVAFKSAQYEVTVPTPGCNGGNLIFTLISCALTITVWPYKHSSSNTLIYQQKSLPMSKGKIMESTTPRPHTQR